ncbi:mycofactocin biosynthesis chaperone MftB [Rhodococcus sp. D2-41]|uniref:Mycofactocin biosynthesis chaperone MftB n=1 Tax=Speluncibacter jeojiensis TaxID=2710754 RepID=A0A9X4RHD3_9ACTN|nr:mycofactocin biosynthesis chaperone MftB [Rhodococcus sp. D2-41]MDG3011700.1 mycofactocin biosynthesis chaperone MftB [Rhodococcus sp. D2-41]MDG3014946.1 mycofactocin biosynthesis chaperone MftB [Corynebacteriales bacterium D3-21]
MSAVASGFELDARWRLHPQVALRPEPFGALLYHFGTRKLSFLKNKKMVSLVQSLPEHPDARAACLAADVDDSNSSIYVRALATLAQSHMLVRDE